MVIAPDAAERIRAICSLDLLRDVCKGRRHGVEENIKNGLVVPILEALGWRNPQDMDFEHRKKDGAADILLKADIAGGHALVVECKSVEIKIGEARVQALRYAQSRGTKYAVLTNGVAWEVLPTFVEGVPIERIRPFYTFTLSQIGKSPASLYGVISKETVGKLDETVTSKRDALRKRIDEEAFLASLTNFRYRLYELIRRHFDAHYPSEPAFKHSVDDWLAKNPGASEWTWINGAEEDPDFWALIRAELRGLGFSEERSTLRRNFGKDGTKVPEILLALRQAGIPTDWVDRLCFEGAYAFVNRILFLRMYEDRVSPSAGGSRALGRLLPDGLSSEDLQAALRLLFSKVRDLFPTLYAVPLYDTVSIETVTWEAAMLREILEYTQKHNFAVLDRDLLGDVYQHHTPRPIRKAFGQFYTIPEVAEYIVRKVADSVSLTTDDVVVDPACGSGTFLLAAYDRLRSTLVARGIEPDDAHAFLLGNSIVGIDVDAFAVQLATINLLLRDINTGASAKGIVQGNSLTQSLSSFDPTVAISGEAPLSLDDIIRRARRRSPNGLRMIVGNPPHHPLRQDNPVYSRAFDGYFAPFRDGLSNIASLFLVRWLKYLAPGGVLAFIVPKVLTWNESYTKVRDWVADRYQILEIVDLGKAWDEVGMEQVIVFARAPDSGQSPDPKADVRIVSGVESPEMLEEGQFLHHSVPQGDLAPKGASWRLYAVDPEFPKIAGAWAKIEKGSIRLSKAAKIFRGYGKKAVVSVGFAKRGSPAQRPFLAGRNIGFDRNFTCWSLNLDELLYADPRDLPGGGNGEVSEKIGLMGKPKIVCKRLVSSDVKVDAYLDEKGEYFSIDTITNVVLNPDSNLRADYVYGILNSILGTVYLRDMVFNRSILTMDLDTPYLGKIPIRVAPPATQNEIGLLARRIQATAAKLRPKEYPSASRRVSGLVEDLDRRVLRAYGVEDYYETFRALRKPGTFDPKQTRLQVLE